MAIKNDNFSSGIIRSGTLLLELFLFPASGGDLPGSNRQAIGRGLLVSCESLAIRTT